MQSDTPAGAALDLMLRDEAPFLVSGTRSGSACRCRSPRAGCRATRRGSGSRRSARSARRPSSRADYARALAWPASSADRWRGLVAVEALARRDVAQQSFAAIVSAAPVEHEAPWPAAPDGSSEMPAHVRVPLRAENDVLHPARPHARGRARVCTGASCGGPEQSGQGRSDDGLGELHAAAQSGARSGGREEVGTVDERRVGSRGRRVGPAQRKRLKK
jgi:hypothetical protein